MSDPILPIDYLDPRRSITEQNGSLTSYFLKTINDIIRRTGGQRADFISDLQTQAYESKALILAAQASSAAALGFTTNPANPLSYTLTSSTQATITIANHTRSTAGAPIVGGALTGRARGETHLVYYDDAGDAGGTVSFDSSTDPRDMDSAGRRMVGAIYLPNPPPSSSGL